MLYETSEGLKYQETNLTKKKNVTKYGYMNKGIVAQLVRVPPCHGGCCGFESRRSRIL